MRTRFTVDQGSEWWEIERLIAFDRISKAGCFFPLRFWVWMDGKRHGVGKKEWMNMGLTTRLGMRNGNDFSALPSSIQHHHHTPTYTTRSLVTTDTPSQWPYRYSTLLLVLFSFSGSRFCSYCKAFNTTTRLEAFRPRRFLLEYTWKATHLKLVFVSGCLLVWLGTGYTIRFLWIGWRS